MRNPALYGQYLTTKFDRNYEGTQRERTALNANISRTVFEAAKAELKPFQSNIDVRTSDGSLLRAVFNGAGFEDFAFGEPIPDVVYFHVNHALPDGGFYPGCKP